KLNFMDSTNKGNKNAPGFAGIIQKALDPLNFNSKFKNQFLDTHTNILLNAYNLNYAALISINQGQIIVKGIKNKPKINLNKNALGWDAFLEMDSSIFLALAMNRLSLFGIIKYWIQSKIKMKGLRKLLVLMKVFKLLG
ncbi:MAG: hypothetical protein P8Y97_17190, partial [Candidatus Lokiarchaeota archaeon]